MSTSTLTPLDAKRLKAGDFAASIETDDLVYFCLNVGDADAQLVLLPADHNNVRRAIVIDAGKSGSFPALIDALTTDGLLEFGHDDSKRAYPIALVVATHPHNDHIAGMGELFHRYGDDVAEFWEPGFYHTAPAYHRMMNEIANLPRLLYTQPTSGMQRWFGLVGVTVMSPAIQLRNRFDTYGVEINDSSISLRLEYPASRVTVEPNGQRNYAPNPKAARLILGADAQTLSWSYVFTDFPVLEKSGSAAAKAIGAATGDWNPLSADVLKVSHHGSKHGVSLELVERVQPAFTIISSTVGGSYGFPHTVTQELIREARQPTTSGQARSSDADLAIFYTADSVTRPAGPDPAGSIAVIARGQRRALWRFGDAPADPLDLHRAWRWT